MMGPPDDGGEQAVSFHPPPPKKPPTLPSKADGKLWLTFAGTVTSIAHNTELPLRESAAFELAMEAGPAFKLLHEVLGPIVELAVSANNQRKIGMVLDAPTWRASPDYLAKLGYKTPETTDLWDVNLRAVSLVRTLRDAAVVPGPKASNPEFVISAEIGPRADGCKQATAEGRSREQLVADFKEYHTHQLKALRAAGVEMVSAYTMSSLPEMLGIAAAAKELGVPLALSPTVGTDGKLPDGTGIGDAIKAVDGATETYPVYYMVNCPHPSHFQGALERAVKDEAAWLPRLWGVRANASCKSHAELDECDKLDEGCPEELGRELATMQNRYGFNVIGGCCGTDARHMAAFLEQYCAAAD